MKKGTVTFVSLVTLCLSIALIALSPEFAGPELLIASKPTTGKSQSYAATGTISATDRHSFSNTFTDANAQR
jgi:hypothetical protein